MPEFIDKYIDEPVEDTENDEDNLLQPEEVPLEDEYDEPQQPVKRRVVGRIPRSFSRPTPPPELVKHRDIIDTGVPDFSPPIPTRQSYMMQDLRQPYYGQQQQTPKTNPDQMAKDQVRIDMAYQREYEKQMRREAMRNQPRISTSDHMMNVARSAAFGSNPSERIKPMGIASFGRAKTSAPVVKKSVATNWNTVIKNIAPRGTGKINTTGTIPLKKRKNSFFGL